MRTPFECEKNAYKIKMIIQYRLNDIDGKRLQFNAT